MQEISSTPFFFIIKNEIVFEPLFQVPFNSKSRLFRFPTRIFTYVQKVNQKFGQTKVRSSTTGCAESIRRWTIQTAFFFLSKAKVLAKLSVFSISSTFIRQVFSAWASIFQIVSLTENLLSQTGRVISDVSVPCFTMGQRNGF